MIEWSGGDIVMLGRPQGGLSDVRHKLAGYGSNTSLKGHVLQVRKIGTAVPRKLSSTAVPRQVPPSVSCQTRTVEVTHMGAEKDLPRQCLLIFVLRMNDAVAPHAGSMMNAQTFNGPLDGLQVTISRLSSFTRRFPNPPMLNWSPFLLIFV